MMNKLVANSETQHRALKLRIYPNLEQTLLINKTFGCCRQIYNTRLYERNQFYNDVIKTEPDKKKQKELWEKAHFSSEKEMKEKFPYKELKTCNQNDLTWMRASASIPFVSHVVKIDGYELLDGGMTVSIPLKSFEDMGYEKNLVVLPQQRVYDLSRAEMLKRLDELRAFLA